CIYPMYDYAHCISDAIEGITHSLCSLEFEDHRPLYDWILDNITIECHPQQIEFARLNPNYMITSKRKLKKLVDGEYVSGWNDPRMPTISGLRRRGYTPGALRKFCEATGVSKANGVIDAGLLEWAIRDDLDSSAPRAMCVLDPIKVTISNYDEDKVENLELSAHPKDESFGKRKLNFTKEVWIDRQDFMEDAPKKFFRLAPGKEVRLRGSYIIKCDEVIKNEQGEVVELICSYDPDTLGKKPEGRKVKGVIHWADVKSSVPVEVRLYDRLFSVPSPEAADENGVVKEFTENLNPESLKVVHGYLEADCAEKLKANPEIGAFQFEREGYFVTDSIDSSADKLIFNKIVSLKDSWEKVK
ncbi:MAG TPA: glutamine--tRNA ligase, partial [Gammaproteobacteria bacterium]|nr:glutamine--tRNA ligase [Gammaproteobacteria bacterium]